MSDYSGDATLEDWLSEEVFNSPVPKEVVDKFEVYRVRVEDDVQAWIDQSTTHRQGWNLWGRGYDTLDKGFYKLVEVCTVLLNLPKCTIDTLSAKSLRS